MPCPDSDEAERLVIEDLLGSRLTPSERRQAIERARFAGMRLAGWLVSTCRVRSPSGGAPGAGAQGRDVLGERQRESELQRLVQGGTRQAPGDFLHPGLTWDVMAELLRLCNWLRVEVFFAEGSQAVCGRLVVASYDTPGAARRPGRITVYPEAVTRVFGNGPEGQNALAKAVAHEIFHHLAATRSGTMKPKVASSQAVDFQAFEAMVRRGTSVRRVFVPALQEVAAGAFAGELLSLLTRQCSPDASHSAPKMLVFS